MSLLNGFLGGCLIGTGAAVALLGAGQIMGFSGIIRPVLKNPLKAAHDPSQQWKLAFLSSFLLSAYAFFLPNANAAKISSVAAVTSPMAYLLSGWLVGMGTTIGNGCTSGHGICGLPRLSKRSLAGVLTFMGTAVATTIITKLPAFDLLRNGANETYLPPWVMGTVTAGMVGLTMYGAWASQEKQDKPTKDPTAVNEAAKLVKNNKEQQETQASTSASTSTSRDERIPASLAGLISGAGLTLSTMVYPASVRGFLDVTAIPLGAWDPTLMLVMGGGLLTSFVSYQFLPNYAIIQSCPKLEKPWAGSKFGVPTNQDIDLQLLTGTALFGVGWGITGLCPGPAVLLTMTGLSGMALQWWPAFWVGSRMGEKLKEMYF